MSTGLGVSLAEALHYVSTWRGKRVVVKFGGRALDTGAVGTLVEDLVLLQKAGLRPVLVHGGGPEISRYLERLQVPTRFVDGLRVTDDATMDVVEMVLAGRVNKQLVNLIQRRGGAAVGLSGKDGAMLIARPHPRAPELGHVGEVEQVQPRLLETLLDHRYIPVVATLGVSRDGVTYNLNADTSAAALAAALGAEKLLLLTDVRGIHREEAGGRELISRLDEAEARRLIDDGVVSSGMIPKVEAALAALDGGVDRAHIISAAEPHAVLVELFTESGAGTMIRRASTGRSSGAESAAPEARESREGGES